MSHNTRARLFVEKFLQDAGAEATDLFKCDLENAIEELLEEVTEETLEAKAPQSLVWMKPKPSSTSFTVTTLRPEKEPVVTELLRATEA